MTGFLSNLNEAAASFNTGLEELAALAEKAIDQYLQMVFVVPDEQSVATVEPAGLPPAGLEPIFRAAGVMVEALDAARSRKSKATKIGNFLSQYVGREAPIQHGDRLGRATLRRRELRANQKHYYFEVRYDAPIDEDDNEQSPEHPAPSPSAGPPAPCPMPTMPNQSPPDDIAAASELVSVQPDQENRGNDESWQPTIGEPHRPGEPCNQSPPPRSTTANFNTDNEL